MNIEMLLWWASKEEKGDIDIYRFYVRMLRDCPEAQTDWDGCKAKLREILEIDD